MADRPLVEARGGGARAGRLEKHERLRQLVRREAAGADPQLDMAVQLALDALRSYRPLSADLTQRPRLELPTLPPRDAETGGNGAAAVKPRPARKAAPAAKPAGKVAARPNRKRS